MSYWILPKSGIPISCTTVQNLTNLEQQTDDWKRRMTQFTEVLEARFQTTSTYLSSSTQEIPPEKILDLERENPEFLADFQRVIYNDTIKYADETENMEIGEVDPYLNMELGLPRGADDSLVHAHVKR
jgi:hypothetical protein